MLRKNKRNNRKRNGDERKSFRDRIRDKIAAITKKQCYVVEKSNEPIGEKEYIVIYECETDKGCNYQRVFKGTFKECKKLKDELNKVLERRVYE